MILTYPRRLVLVAVTLAFAFGPAAALGAEKAKGEKYALLVGVKSYDPAELRSLQFTENDVRDLGEVLKLGGYRPENIRLMTYSKAGENPLLMPTGEYIRRELKRLVEDCTEDDSVLVAFAGHGVKFKDREESYFCPADAKLDKLETLLSVDEIYGQLEACRARFRVLLVDACRDDPANALDRGPRARLESVTRPQTRPVPGGVAAMFSCSSGEKAFEHKDLKHGVFFHFVIEALAGGAAQGDDDEITLNRLSGYVQKRVKDFVWDKFTLRQMPEMKISQVKGDPAIVRLVNRKLEAHLRKALNSYNAKSYKAALAEYNQLLKADPDNEEAYLRRGFTKFRLEDYDGAVLDFKKAIQLNPENANAWMGIGDVRYYGQEDAARSIISYNKAIELKPKTAMFYARRGAAYHQNEEYPKAMSDYNMAIELNPLYAEAYYYRAQLWRDKENTKRALADIKEALQIDPQGSTYRQFQAKLKENQGDVQGALTDYAKAIKVDPKDEAAYYNRGATYLRQGDYDSAVSNYNQVVQLNSNNADAYYWRGYANQANGRYDAAVADYDRTLRLRPGHSGASNYRAGALEGRFGGRAGGGGILGGGGRQGGGGILGGGMGGGRMGGGGFGGGGFGGRR